MTKLYYWIFLFAAILLGTLGAYFLKVCQGFTKLVPTILMAVTYLLCGWLFSLAIKEIEIGLAYAVWAGLGTALIVIMGVVCFNEHITIAKAAFMIAIVISAIGLCVTSSPR